MVKHRIEPKQNRYDKMITTSNKSNTLRHQTKTHQSTALTVNCRQGTSLQLKTQIDDRTYSLMMSLDEIKRLRAEIDMYLSGMETQKI